MMNLSISGFSKNDVSHKNDAKPKQKKGKLI